MARTIPVGHREVYAAIAALDEVEGRRLFGADAFFTRGRMFAFLFEHAVVLKLAEPARTQLLEAGLARPFLAGTDASFGRWVELPLAGLESTRHAIELVTMAHALAQTAPHDGPRRRKRRRGIGQPDGPGH